MMNRMKTLLIGLVLAVVAIGMAAGTAFAEDVVKLKNGTEYRGTIVNDRGGAVFIEVKYGTLTKIEIVAQSDIAEIIRDAESIDADGDKAEAPKVFQREAPAVRRPGVPRAAVISLEGTVGQLLTAQSLENILPMLEAEDIDIVVFRIHSPGGLTIEVDRLSEVIHTQYKPKFRVVSWIKSAISAASMTSHNIEEIYFRPEGAYGGSTQFNGGTGVASTGRSLEEILFRAEGWSERGGYPIEIMEVENNMVKMARIMPDLYRNVSGFED
jgi:membrane-bound ClpP family serine protease